MSKNNAKQKRQNNKQNKKAKEKSKKELLKEEISSIIQNRWDIAKSNNQMEIIIHTGTPNSGKTYRAIQSLKQPGIVGAYLAPLRLLASEIFDTLNDVGVKTSLLTGEEKKIIDGALITSSTIEMFNFNKEYDIVIIDEMQLIADNNRGNAWMNAFLKAKTKTMHIIVAPQGVELISKILDKLNKKYTINSYTRFVPIEVAKNPDNLNKPIDKTIYIAFSRRDVLELKEFFENKNVGVSVLYGNLPPEVKKLQAQKFIDGENKIAVATDCLGLGINLPADRIVFTQIERYDGLTTRNLNAAEVMQIGSRCGRYGLSELGTVSALNKKNLAFIKYKMEEEIEPLNKGLIGPEIEELNLIPKPLLADKLVEWSKLELIPNELKHLVGSIYLDEKIDLARKINKDQQDILGLEKANLLIQAPVSRGITQYWMDCIFAICKGSFIPLPETMNKVSSKDDVELLESFIHQHTLYCWLALRKQFEYCCDNIDFVYENKKKLVLILDQALINFNLMKNRLCISCQKEIIGKFKICQDCYDQRLF